MMQFKFEEQRIRLKTAKGETLMSEKPIESAKDAIMLMRDEMITFDREYLIQINVDFFGRPINYHVASMGDLCRTISPHRAIMSSALLSDAVGIIIMHNHPRGTMTMPSDEDVKSVKAMEIACDYMGIEMIDHLIVCDDCPTYSFKMDCYIDFEKRHPDKLKEWEEYTGIKMTLVSEWFKG